MPKKPKIEFKCEKCGKSQLKDEAQSNRNWAVFNCDETCECGGKYAMYVDGQKIG